MHYQQALSQTLVKTPCMLLRPPVAPYRPNGHRQYTLAFHAAAADEAAADEQPQQSTAQEQQNQGKQHLKARIKRLASSWKNNRTPNTGLVSITHKSVTSRAAASVAADLKEKAFTRIVARSSADIPKAVNVIHIGTQTVNHQAGSEQQQQQDGQQQQQQSGTRDGQRVLVFQPVRVDGVLVAPPALPEGATALYTYMLPADNQALQVAGAERAKLRAAASSRNGDGGSSSSSRRLSAADGAVSVTGSSNIRGAAGAIVESIHTRGWAELTSYGGPLATKIAIEALTTARGLLYKSSNQDVAAVFLEFWKKERTTAAVKQQQSGVSIDTEAAGQQQEQQQQHPQGEDIQPLPFRCATFLLVACAKNKPNQLLVPQQQPKY